MQIERDQQDVLAEYKQEDRQYDEDRRFEADLFIVVFHIHFVHLSIWKDSAVSV